MPFQDPAEQPSDFPNICSISDHGGGVSLHDAFVVYTTRSLYPQTASAMRQSISPLTNLASKVARYIRIYYKIPPDSCLRTLPHKTTARPIFLTNASSSREICIAGTKDATTTLLAILRRAWCILELCSANSQAIVALLEFAQAAQTTDCDGYAAAVALLLHQSQFQIGSQRTLEIGEMLNDSDDLMDPRKREGMTELKRACAVLFRPSLDSFNGFYMRAIVTVTIWMAVGWHTMAKFLAGQEDAIREKTFLGDNANSRQMWPAGSVPFHCLAEIQRGRWLGLNRTLAALLDLQQERCLKECMGRHSDATPLLPLAEEASPPSRSIPALSATEALMRRYKDVLDHLALNIG